MFFRSAVLFRLEKIKIHSRKDSAERIRMHPLVRDLYKRALVVGRDYPTGLSKIRGQWKEALRNPKNCPSCYEENGVANVFRDGCETEILRAVAKGRHMIREMKGVIQLKKYRTLKQRYT